MMGKESPYGYVLASTTGSRHTEWGSIPAFGYRRSDVPLRRSGTPLSREAASSQKKSPSIGNP